MGVLRLALALAVFCEHTIRLGGYPWIIGKTAVYVFFVISGFYMQMVIEQKYNLEKLGKSWIWRFWAARYFRLYPPFITVVILYFLVAFVIHEQSGAWIAPIGDLAALTGATGAGERLLVGFSTATMFFSNVPPSYLLVSGVFWTLGVELSFYLIAPFILRTRTVIIVSVGLLSICLRLLPLNTHLPLFSNLDLFLLGALAYRFRNILSAWAAKTDRRLLAVAVVIVTFALITTTGDTGADNWTHPLLAAAAVPTLFEYSKALRWNTIVGDLSYPFYVCHELIARSVYELFGATDADKSRWGLALLSLACAIAGAIALLALERALIEPLRRRLASRPKQIADMPLQPQTES